MKITKQRLAEIIREELEASVTELEQVGDKEGSGVSDETPRDVTQAMTFVKQKINQTDEIEPFLVALAAEINAGMEAVPDGKKKDALVKFITMISKLQPSTGTVLPTTNE
jgi:hypothetical protein